MSIRMICKAGFLLTVICVFAPLYCGEIIKPMPDRVYDTRIGPDEAAAGVKITTHRWPDCETLETMIRDIFRLERARTPEEKALAMWRWYCILVQQGPTPPNEGLPGKEGHVWDGHKLITVYGTHHCSGHGQMLAAMWRAAGHLAYKGYYSGHTQAEIFYRDYDGVERFHMFDGVKKYYVPSPDATFIYGMKENALYGSGKPEWFHCHYETIVTHTLRTSLRIGETIERMWDSHGYIITAGKEKDKYWKYTKGSISRSVNAVAGEEIQVFEVPISSDTYKLALYSGSAHTAASSPSEGKALLHADSKGAVGTFIYRLSPPYPIADAELEALAVTASPKDMLRISVTRDVAGSDIPAGRTWHTVYEKKKPGIETVKLNLCRSLYDKKDPASLMTAYDVLVKIECRSAGNDQAACGFSRLKLTAHRHLNRRCLPQLLPGENHMSLECEKLDPRYQLEAELHWIERDKTGPKPARGKDWPVKERSHKVTAVNFPHAFEINITNVLLEPRRNWIRDGHFGGGTVEMKKIVYRLIPRVKPSIDDLAKKLSSSNKSEARNASWQIARLGTPEALKVLKDAVLVRDKKFKRVQNNAILNIQFCPKKAEATAILLKLFPGVTEKDKVDLSYPQLWALKSLSALAQKEAKDTVLYIHQHDDSWMDKAVATLALKSFQGDDVRTALEKQVTSIKTHPEHRWIAAYALGFHKKGVDCLLAILKNEKLNKSTDDGMGQTSGDLLLYVIRALGRIGNPKAIDPVLEFWSRIQPIEKWNPYIRMESSPGQADLLPAIRGVPMALVGMKAHPKKAVPSLVNKLPEVRSDVRYEILKSLGYLGGELAVNTLTQYAENDPEAYCREMAERSLKRLGYKEPLRKLVQQPL